MSDLCTTAQVKSILGISTADTRNDGRIATLIGIVSGMAERYCRRAFITATYSEEVYDGTNSAYLLLKNYPVSSVAEVKVLDYIGDSGRVVDTSDYRLDKSSGSIYKPSIWTEGDGNYLVTYTAGLGATVANLPSDLTGAVAAWVASCFEGDNVDAVRATSGQYNITLIGASLPNADIRMALDKYRRPSV
jgi:uncharacterized phiE125 gp8 family phage protein